MRLDLTPRACEVCQRRDGLLRCSGCQSVYYCGRDHQRARARLKREEQMLRDNPGDIITPANVFDSGVGRFWGIFETRPYMRARFGLVDILLQHFGSAGGRVDVVRAALDHLLDMLRLCRSDNMGLRDLIPALYIRLGRDQAAYDFVKWYATTGQDSYYNWGDVDLPFLDVKDADVLEPSQGLWLEKSCLDLSHAVTVALLKVRVLLDLQAVQNAARMLRGTVPPEIIDLIRARLVGSVVEARPEILRSTAEEIAPLVQEIKRQEEACLMLGYTFAAWAETPGAIDVVRSLSKAP
ncbi:MYND finger domain-containing protein [Hirsutella rhossiliensis]|uniref:MYND finger domain-containing protein n=1 Tax=Hirsutella rhossiliensis TaxID=111463 RepID=A0A9P8MN59_9HYPO|nr:MYND finger domain-containing protein [Hirsutella rhossiliensis]KAH0958210.1 MYND finger domain-containing protein [Hirsutella rhossiliensis]